MLSKNERTERRKIWREKTKANKALRKKIKKQAGKGLRRNYIACIAVCFIMVFIAGEYSTTTQGVSSYDNNNVADLKYNAQQRKTVIEDMIENHITAADAAKKWKISDSQAVTKWYKVYQSYGIEGLNSKEVTFFGGMTNNFNWDKVRSMISLPQSASGKLKTVLNYKETKLAASAATYFDGVTKNNSYQLKFVDAVFTFLSKASTWDALVSIFNFISSVFVAIFITNILTVGERRFFLENRTYKKTKIGRLGFLYRERTMTPALTMFVKSVYYMLWTCTIVGGIIKTYSYAMVPYICAENPNLKPNEAITLSRKMMDGHKLEMFVLDFSMLGWVLLSIVTFGLAGILYSNPYRTAVETEFYISVRKEAIKKKIDGYEGLNDKYLDLDLLEEQLYEQAERNGENIDVIRFRPVFTIEKSDEENQNGGEGK